MYHATAVAVEMRRRRLGGSRRGEATSVTRGDLTAAAEGAGAGMTSGTIGEESEESTTSGDTTIDGRLVVVIEAAGEATSGEVTADEEAGQEDLEVGGITAIIVQDLLGMAQTTMELTSQRKASTSLSVCSQLPAID